MGMFDEDDKWPDGYVPTYERPTEEQPKMRTTGKWGMKPCPSCGYTEEDARINGDHYLCKNAGNAPWEKRADVAQPGPERSGPNGEVPGSNPGIGTKLCSSCGQPLKPKGIKKRPFEYDHAQGCRYSRPQI